MLFMTAKLDMKKWLLIALAVLVVVIGLFWFFGDRESNTAQTASSNAASNNDRIAFLKSFGWDVSASPTESGQVKIPDNDSQIYTQYNELQKSQGYDLSSYAGKTVMRYVYKINNYPGASDPVYATLLVYKNSIIGGDITDTAAKGKIHAFTMPKSEFTEPSQENPIIKNEG